MSDIKVLVSGNVNPKVKGGVISNEENSITDSAAMDFAAIFGGWMAQVMGQGQDSGSQSNDPAGKEANSGQKGIQGLEGMLGSLRTIAGLSLGSVSGQDQQGSDALMKAISPEIMTLLSKGNLQGDVAGPGMGSGQLQGEKSPYTELDQYRVLITSLLQDMSGEISRVSMKPTDIQGLLTQLSQGLNSNLTGVSSYVQSILAQTIENQSIQNQVLSQTLIGRVDLANQPLTSQAETNSLSALQEYVAGIAQIVNSDDNTAGLREKLSKQVTEFPQISRMLVDSNQNNEIEAVQTAPLNRNLNLTQNIPLAQNQNNLQQEELSTGSRLIQANIKTEVGQGGTSNEKNEILGNSNSANSKDAGSEGSNPILGNYNLANLTLNSAPVVGDKMGATPNVPIWQQVAQELQNKVFHQLPVVRELDIQLHPAELGQITISLILDNGQVHLHMVASEVATGQILQNSFPELRESLFQSGVQCGMMQMGLSDSNQNFNQSQNQTFTSLTKNQDKQESDDSIIIDEARLNASLINDRDQGIRETNRINVTA